MKAVVVRLSTIQKHGWLPRTYTGGTTEQDAKIKNAKRAIKAAKARLRNEQIAKKQILDFRAKMVANGEVKPLT